MPLENALDGSPFWSRLFGAVTAVESAMELALQSSGSDTNDKGVSAITKKKLAQRSVQGLTQSKVIISDLSRDLRELQRATREWRNNIDFASKSQQELMEQAEAMSMDLQTTIDQLHHTEAARLTASREAQSLISKLQEMEGSKIALETSLKDSREKEDKARREVISIKQAMHELRQECDRIQQAAREKTQEAERATEALESARQEVNRAATASQRHQEVVAQLTADNLVLLMQLKKAEAELETAHTERSQLRMAVEKQRGPWFAEVRAGVEAKVKEAMSRAEVLEQELEALKSKHSASMEAMSQEKAELEAFLESSRAEEARLSALLAESQATELRARDEAKASAEQAQKQEEKATALQAEVKALLSSARSMREECNERWLTEQAASKSAAELEAALARDQAELSRLQAEVRRLQSSLDAQVGVNRQLMARKEEVEWQLMAALAQVDGCEPMPLNVTVSGRMQVDKHPANAYVPLSVKSKPSTRTEASAASGAPPSGSASPELHIPATPSWHPQQPPSQSAHTQTFQPATSVGPGKNPGIAPSSQVQPTISGRLSGGASLLTAASTAASYPGTPARQSYVHTAELATTGIDNDRPKSAPSNAPPAYGHARIHQAPPDAAFTTALEQPYTTTETPTAKTVDNLDTELSTVGTSGTHQQSAARPSDESGQPGNGHWGQRKDNGEGQHTVQHQAWLEQYDNLREENLQDLEEEMLPKRRSAVDVVITSAPSFVSA